MVTKFSATILRLTKLPAVRSQISVRTASEEIGLENVSRRILEFVAYVIFNKFLYLP